MSLFLFTDDPDSLEDEESLLIVVPAGHDEKKRLLAWYAEALRFPVYFGGNWDALSDCLGDLSWIAEKSILIAHRDMPLATEAAGRSIYLDILANAVRSWEKDAARSLAVAFPSWTRGVYVWPSIDRL